ncbi:MAG: glycosyltransferase [Dysgonamonadaceae bacterium]|nr:glycosyltransferase [Dysgonamonadaceae bacterium]
MKLATFSIITVTYNAAQYIERTLQSVASQTCKDFEYIIVDGASNDGTLEIIANYELRITNFGCKFLVISEKDQGLYDAMNKGLRLATGDYVWFLNAGDTFYNENTLQALNTQHLTLNTQYSVLYGETEVVNSSGNSLGMRRLRAPKQLDWKSFRMGMTVCHQSFVVKRAIAPEFDLQYRYASDIDWCINCMKKTDSIHNTHLILSRFLEAGLSAQKRKEALKERYRIMCRNYGVIPTIIRHLWFALRFYTAKLLKKTI